MNETDFQLCQHAYVTALVRDVWLPMPIGTRDPNYLTYVHQYAKEYLREILHVDASLAGKLIALAKADDGAAMIRMYNETVQ